MSFGQTPSASLGGFGQQAAAPAANAFSQAVPAPGGFGGFGQTARPAAAANLGGGAGAFGQSGAAAPAVSWGGLGGGAAPAASAAPAAGGFGGGFGASPAGAVAPAPPIGGGFGSGSGVGAAANPTISAAPVAPVAGGFPVAGGLGSQPAAPGPGFGQLGMPTGAIGFGSQAAQVGNATPRLASAGNGFPGYPGGGQQQLPQGREGFEGELSRIADIIKQYAPVQQSGDGNPHGLTDTDANINSNRPTQGPFPWNEDCAFKFTIYPPKDAAGRYLQFKDEYLDSVAIERNPDPDRLVPRTLMGATELLSRYKSQNSDVARMVSDLEKIKTSQIGPIRHEQSQLSVKYRQFKDKHNEQARRLTKLLRDVEVLRNRGRPLHNEEIKHREEYDRAIVVKSGFEGKLLQLENLTAAYSAEVGENAENEQFEDMTDYDLHAIYELLSRQHEGILHLTHILDKDLRDAEIMAQGLR